MTILSVSAMVWIFAAALHSSAQAQPSSAADKPSGCISWRPESRFVGHAYNHYVHITNKCDRRFECTVKTDVNPEPIVGEIEPKAQKTILTFRGSPASVFKATVVCKSVKK